MITNKSFVWQYQYPEKRLLSKLYLAILSVKQTQSDISQFSHKFKIKHLFRKCDSSVSEFRQRNADTLIFVQNGEEKPS